MKQSERGRRHGMNEALSLMLLHGLSNDVTIIIWWWVTADSAHRCWITNYSCLTQHKGMSRYQAWCEAGNRSQQCRAQLSEWSLVRSEVIVQQRRQKLSSCIQRTKRLLGATDTRYSKTWSSSELLGEQSYYEEKQGDPVVCKSLFMSCLVVHVRM